MKEALIVFIIALVIGSIMNSMKGLDSWGVSSNSATSAANRVPSVNEANFQQNVLESDLPVLVDFYTDNSDNSKAMVPVVMELADSLEGKVKIVRMEANDSPQMSDKYNITTVPDFVLFKGGERIDHIVGVQSKDQLLTFLQTHLTDSPAASQTHGADKPPAGGGLHSDMSGG